MRRYLLHVFFVFLITTTPVGAGADSGSIREDFASTPSPDNWYVCRRPENNFRFGQKQDEGRTALVATVRPEPKTFALWREHHVGCLDDRSEYERDGDERAEIWESDRARLKLGTDIWYRFDMYLDNSLSKDSKRFVSGQWKEHKAARGGPLLAQRFTGRRFTVSVEQDNLDPARKPDDVLCRVLVADQSPLSESPAGWPHDDKAKEVPPKRGVWANTSAMHPSVIVAKEAGCARDIVAQQFHVLPDPFGRWTTMVYHLALTPDDKALVELWADGTKIAFVKGRIGYAKAGERFTQYFKFGPYRDPETYDTVTKLANFVRSPLRKDVDPTGELTLEPPTEQNQQ